MIKSAITVEPPRGPRDLRRVCGMTLHPHDLTPAMATALELLVGPDEYLFVPTILWCTVQRSDLLKCRCWIANEWLSGTCAVINRQTAINLACYGYLAQSRLDGIKRAEILAMAITDAGREVCRLVELGSTRRPQFKVVDGGRHP